ncbi:MAG: hypothetical protein HQM01_07180 [Magnetococcales bacterium]|nr:hypothetical protein [Magnetococcales bacterium]
MKKKTLWIIVTNIASEKSQPFIIFDNQMHLLMIFIIIALFDACLSSESASTLRAKQIRCNNSLEIHMFVMIIITRRRHTEAHLFSSVVDKKSQDWMYNSGRHQKMQNASFGVPPLINLFRTGWRTWTHPISKF